MHFRSIYGFRRTILCNICLSTPNPLPRMFTSNGKPYLAGKNEELLLFYKNEVQDILKSLTGFDLNKVFSKRKLEVKLEPPKYKFMTSEQVKEAIEQSKQQAEELLQMPPVVPVRKEIDVVLSKDRELIGLSKCKYVLTDISFGKTDRTRTIVVRDPDGTLRQAYWLERRNANQTYFPRPGRQFKIPKMFQPDFLKPILERGDYIFILDRACVEFDADDPEYHRVTHATYDHIQEKSAFGTLRFTRHFGPMVFYLVLNNNIDSLLLENLQTDKLTDAATLITLYHLLHPQAKSAGTKLHPGQEITFIKEYIDKDSKSQVVLDLALLAHKDHNKATQALSASTN